MAVDGGSLEPVVGRVHLIGQIHTAHDGLVERQAPELVAQEHRCLDCQRDDQRLQQHRSPRRKPGPQPGRYPTDRVASSDGSSL